MDDDFSNFQSIMPSNDISPNSRYDQCMSFDSGDALYGEDDDHGPSRPVAPNERYNLDDDNDPLPGNNGYATDIGDIGAESPELASIFALVSSFQPNIVEAEVHWKPFLPELAPAIGSIDAFIKIPRPDGEIDEAGLVVLDEPSITQSNRQILKMELREQYGVSGPTGQGDAYIGSIEESANSTKELAAWLESIEEIHRQRPPPAVIYSSKMPEFESLMEPWPDRFEEVLKALVPPPSELDVSFDDYVRIICAVLEIPVRGNIVESLHHLFALYSEFEGNQHFRGE